MNLIAGSCMSTFAETIISKQMKHIVLSVTLVLVTAFVSFAQNDGWVRIYPSDSTANGAQVYLDGKLVSEIPSTIVVQAGKHQMVIKKKLFKDKGLNVFVKPGRTSDVEVKLEKNYSMVKVLSVNDAMIYIDGVLVSGEEWGNTGTLPIEYGTHEFMATLKGYAPSKISVDVTERTSEVRIPSPEPLKGAVTVNSNIIGATVCLDGKSCGKTPLTIDNLLVGDYCVSVSKSGYTSGKKMVSVEEGKDAVVSIDLNETQNVEILTNVYNPVITVGDRLINGNEVALENGQYPVEIAQYGYKTVRGSLNVKPGPNIYKYRLKRDYGEQFSYDGDIYAEIGSRLNRYSGTELNFGFNVESVNVEFNMMFGSTRSKWIPVIDDYLFSYKPAAFIGLNLGYGILLGNRIRITPQLGLGTQWCGSKYEFTGVAEEDDSKNGYGIGYVPSYTDTTREPYEDYKLLVTLSFVAGCKFEFALCEWCSVYAKPAYTIPIVLGDSPVRQVMNMSDEVAGYFKGLDVNVGLNFHANF